LWASIGVFHLETHLVPLSKSLVAFHGYGREMNKQVLTLFPLDKTYPLFALNHFTTPSAKALDPLSRF
jgi:hypothetical protein